jgi:DNA polymerase III epsilon subunit-like protein
LSRKAWPGLTSYRLGDLARVLKLPIEGNLHRAESDARLTWHLWAAIRSKLANSRKSPRQVHTR